MTTKHRKTKAVARSGINYVRRVVENCNCIFQEIDLDNDIGNDAYIEFIDDEAATGCCIAVQIKSGESYFIGKSEYATLKSDKNHFEYWNSHLLPVAAIVYNPLDERAVWIDITDFLLRNHERIAVGPYNLPVPLAQEFSTQNFIDFYSHFSGYKDRYKQDSYFGAALEQFSCLSDVERCLDGIYSLFSFHRNRRSVWYYLVSCFRNFRNHPARNDLIIALSHVPGHPDIFWHKGNIIDEGTRKSVCTLMATCFDREEVLLLLESIDENGIARGTIGQCIHAIIDVLENKVAILKSIAFDPSLPEDTRYWALILFAYYLQSDSISGCASAVKRYIRRFPHGQHSCILAELARDIKAYGGFNLY